MYRGAWWATVHGVARVRHDLAIKPPNQGKAIEQFKIAQLSLQM